MAIELIQIKDGNFPKTSTIDGTGLEYIVVSKADGVTYGMTTSDFKAFLGTVQVQVPKALSPSDPVPVLAGVYIPTVNGTYPDGIVVDLSDGYNQLIFDGTDWVKIVSPIDLAGVVPKSDIIDNLIDGGGTKVLSAEQGVVLNDKIDSAIVETGILEQSLYTTGSTGTWSSQSSIFNGWGETLPATSNFNGVRIKIQYWDVTAPVTQVRILVRQTDRFGAIITDQVIPFTAGVLEERYVVATFPNFANAGNVPIWVEYNVDGKIGKALSPTNPTIGATTRYRTTAMTGSNFADQSADDGSDSTFYVELGVFSEAVEATDMFLSGLKEQLGILGAEVVLQSKILATEGVETNIYFDDIINSDILIDQLKIDVTCTKGEQLERCFRVTPVLADVGTFPLKIEIRNGNSLLYTYNGELIIKSAAAGASSSKKVLCVGDSTTAGGQYIMLINNDYTPLASPNITFIGTVGSVPNLREGYSGWRYSNFATNTGTNPFWNTSTNQFDFQNYLTTNGFTMSANDLITMHLGINDVFGSADNINQVLGYIDFIIAGFRSAVANINIGVCLPIAPSISQDAFGDDYANGQTLKGYLSNRFALVKAMIERYDTDEMRTDKIWLFGFNHVIDRVNNFPKILVNANARNTDQITMYNNGVHPAQSGYEQMGDSLYCGIKSLY